MKSTIITLLLLCTLTSFTQKSQKGKIIYIATFSFDSFYKSKGEIANAEKDKDYIENTEDIECVLTFNENESYFKKNDGIAIDRSKYNMVNIKVGSGECYYNKKEGTTTEKKEFLGEKLLITKEKINWVFTTDTKIISGYTCKKATAILIQTGRIGKIKKNIVAWYAPEIPINFGPKNYNGLPGLVISLQEGNLYYIATKIILNTKEDVIVTKPTKGKRVTQKEYTEMLSEFRKDRTNPKYYKNRN